MSHLVNAFVETKYHCPAQFTKKNWRFQLWREIVNNPLRSYYATEATREVINL